MSLWLQYNKTSGSLLAWFDDTVVAVPSGCLELTTDQISILQGTLWHQLSVNVNGDMSIYNNMTTGASPSGVLYNLASQSVDNTGTVYTLPTCAAQYITTNGIVPVVDYTPSAYGSNPGSINGAINAATTTFVQGQ